MIGGTYVGSLTRHVFETLAHAAGIALHVRVLVGPRPAPHRRGAVQGGRPRLRGAVELDPRAGGAVPSTKGTL